MLLLIRSDSTSLGVRTAAITEFPLVRQFFIPRPTSYDEPFFMQIRFIQREHLPTRPGVQGWTQIWTINFISTEIIYRFDF